MVKKKRAKKRAKGKIAKKSSQTLIRYEKQRIESNGQKLPLTYIEKGTSGTGPRICGDNDDET